MNAETATERLDEAVIEMCPSCGAYLEDTYDGDGCLNCGFSYVIERETASEESSRDSRLPVRRPTLGILALMAAYSAGGLVNAREIISQTESGVTIDPTAPDVWLSFGLLVVALLAMVAATGGEHR